MQHGIVGNFHPGYSFGKIQPDHFPDEIMLFDSIGKTLLISQYQN